MEAYIHQIRPYLEHYGYWIVFGSILLENFGIPLPGETMLITAAILAARTGQMSLLPLILTGWVAAVAGDNIGYGVGHFAGRRLVIQYGKYLFITDRRLKRAEAVFAKYGGLIVIVARFIEVLRQLNGIAAGTANMAWHRFLAYNILGAGLWVAFWTVLFYWLSDRATIIFHYFSKFEAFILAGLGAFGAIGILYLLLRRLRSR